MLWLLAIAVLVAIGFRLARRRRTLVAVSLSDSISTVHLERSKRHDAKKKAALDAATSSLR